MRRLRDLAERTTSRCGDMAESQFEFPIASCPRAGFLCGISLPRMQEVRSQSTRAGLIVCVLQRGEDGAGCKEDDSRPDECEEQQSEDDECRDRVADVIPNHASIFRHARGRGSLRGVVNGQTRGPGDVFLRDGGLCPYEPRSETVRHDQAWDLGRDGLVVRQALKPLEHGIVESAAVVRRVEVPEPAAVQVSQSFDEA